MNAIENGSVVVNGKLTTGGTKTKGHSVPHSHKKLASGILTKGSVDDYQFARSEGYSKVKGQDIPKKDGTRIPNSGKSSAYGVIGEAARAGAEFQQNITNMLKPEPLYGTAPEKLQDWLKDIYKKADQLKEHRIKEKDGSIIETAQRTSTLIILGSIYSYPGKYDPTNERQKAWRDATVEFNRNYFGEYLVSVVAHIDEENYHIHAIAADEGRPVKWMLQGQAAADQAIKNGKSGADVTKAFKKGYSDWQDLYFKEVCEQFGFKRKMAVPAYRMRYNKAKRQQLERNLRQLNERIAQFDAQNAIKIAEISAREEAVSLLSQSVGVESAAVQGEMIRINKMREDFQNQAAMSQAMGAERAKITAQVKEQNDLKEAQRVEREEKRLKKIQDEATEKDQAFKAREEKVAAREAKMAEFESTFEAKDAANQAKVDRLMLDNQALKRAFEAIEKYVPAEMKKEARQAAMDAFHSASVIDQKIKPN